MLKHLTTQEFKEKVFNYEQNQEWKFEGDKPCLIDFYADWCSPCKMVAPILEELAKEYEDQIVIYKVNVDNESELATALGIKNLPTILFIPKKGDPQLMVGSADKSTFKRAIDQVLLGKPAK